MRCVSPGGPGRHLQHPRLERFSPSLERHTRYNVHTNLLEKQTGYNNNNSSPRPPHPQPPNIRITWTLTKAAAVGVRRYKAGQARVPATAASSHHPRPSTHHLGHTTPPAAKLKVRVAYLSDGCCCGSDPHPPGPGHGPRSGGAPRVCNRTGRLARAHKPAIQREDDRQLIRPSVRAHTPATRV